MACIPRPKLNKVPGGMPLIKQDNHIKDLTKLTNAELLEIKEREDKLLANKSKLHRLPDKGKRIQDFYDKVLAEFERRANVNVAAEMFSSLNIAENGEHTLNELEWRGHLANTNDISTDPTVDVLDSDDECDMDPLRVIAQRTMHERRIKILPAEPQLITAEDLLEIKSFAVNSSDSISTESTSTADLSVESTSRITKALNDSATIDAEIITIDVSETLPQLKPKLQQINGKPIAKTKAAASPSSSSTPDIEQHVRYLVDKTELQPMPGQREKFKPYQTTLTNVHDPAKERVRKKGKHWEITAATPPLIKHGAAKMITLLDSVDIQVQYLSKLKDLQTQQAAERLAAKVQRLEQRKIQLPNDEVLKNNAAFNVYRTPIVNIEGEQHYNDIAEVHDTLDEERPSGGITYTVYE